MSVTYRIHPDLGLVHVRYEGFARLQDTMRAVGAYMADPDFAQGQKQLVDLAALTGFEKDYAQVLSVQAKKAEAFFDGPENIMVYYAPTEVSLQMAEIAARSWEDIDAVVAIVAQTEADALAILGISASSLDELSKRPA